MLSRNIYIESACKFGVMQMAMSVQQMCIAKHYLMTNDIVIYHFKNIVSFILW